MVESSIARRTIGIAVGIVTAMVIVGVVEAIGHRLFPLPPGIDLSDPADMRRLIETMPAAAKSMVLAAWFLGALVGGWVALVVSRWRLAPWIISAAIVAGGIWSMVMIPHPVWMMAAGIALPLLAAALVLRRNRISPSNAGTFA